MIKPHAGRPCYVGPRSSPIKPLLPLDWCTTRSSALCHQGQDGNIATQLLAWSPHSYLPYLVHSTAVHAAWITAPFVTPLSIAHRVHICICQCCIFVFVASILCTTVHVVRAVLPPLPTKYPTFEYPMRSVGREGEVGRGPGSVKRPRHLNSDLYMQARQFTCAVGSQTRRQPSV